MKEKAQKNGEPAPTCPGENRPEAEGITGGQTYLWMAEKSGTDAYQTGEGMLEQILSPTNLNRAYKQVMSNKGSGGVDRMGVDQLKDYLLASKDELSLQIPTPVCEGVQLRRGLPIPERVIGTQPTAPF